MLSRAIFPLVFTFLGVGYLGAYEEKPVCLLLFNGKEVKGLVLDENDESVRVLTLSGEIKMAKGDIVGIKREMDVETLGMLRALMTKKMDPGAKAIDPSHSPLPLQLNEELKKLSSGKEEIRIGGPRRMDLGGRFPNRNVTLDLGGEKLDSTVNFLSSLSGVTIILDPKVRAANHVINLKVSNMSLENALLWIAKLTGTHLQLKDGAVYISEKNVDGDEEDRNTVTDMMTRAGVDPKELPPQGTSLTNADITRIALAIWEKSNPKPPDFPGPPMLGAEGSSGQNAVPNPFAGPGQN